MECAKLKRQSTSGLIVVIVINNILRNNGVHQRAVRSQGVDPQSIQRILWVSYNNGLQLVRAETFTRRYFFHRSIARRRP